MCVVCLRAKWIRDVYIIFCAFQKVALYIMRYEDCFGIGYIEFLKGFSDSDDDGMIVYIVHRHFSLSRSPSLSFLMLPTIDSLDR